MANCKFVKNRSELELILGAGERFCRSDQRMAIIYRLHNLPPRRINNLAKYVDQDFVLNLAIGDKYILAQEEGGDLRFGDSCYRGEFGSTDDNPEIYDDEDEYDSDDDLRKHQVLVGACYSKYLDPRKHRQVGRDESGLWVKDFGSKHGTFVNGIKLDVDVCQRLKSGDLISLGFIYEEDKPLTLESEHYWVFKVFEMSQSEFEHRKEVATQAMGISVVLDSILSNFDYDDIKRYRSVSKVWDEVAKRKLRTLARVVFLLYDPTMDNNRTGSWSQRWFAEAQNRLSSLQNISFKENNSTLDFPTERLIFLQNILTTNQITSVEIDFLAESENVSALFKSILACPRLVEVKFNSMLFEQFLGHDYEEFGTNESVTKLIFQEKQSDYYQLLRLFPNTREIEFLTTITAENFLDDKYEDELEAVKVLKISDKGKTKESIRMLNVCDDCNIVHFIEVGNLSICKFSPLICALPHSIQLTTLEISDLHDFMPSDAYRNEPLFNLLSKFKDTLKVLKLGLILHGHSHLGFPKMKVLSFFKLEVQKEGWEHSTTSGFGEEYFPRLKVLELVCGKSANEFAVALGSRNLGSPHYFENAALRELRFVFPTEKMKDQFSDLAAERNFRRLFPNAVTFIFGYIQ